VIIFITYFINVCVPNFMSRWYLSILRTIFFLVIRLKNNFSVNLYKYIILSKNCHLCKTKKGF